MSQGPNRKHVADAEQFSKSRVSAYLSGCGQRHRRGYHVTRGSCQGVVTTHRPEGKSGKVDPNPRRAQSAGGGMQGPRVGAVSCRVQCHERRDGEPEKQLPRLLAPSFPKPARAPHCPIPPGNQGQGPSIQLTRGRGTRGTSERHR